MNHCATGSHQTNQKLVKEIEKNLVGWLRFDALDCKWIYQVSIYTLSDLGYSSNLIGSLSRANAALFTRYRVDNALSHKTETKWPA